VSTEHPKVTGGLAAFVRDTRLAAIPDEVVGKAAKAIVDAFGAILCGAASEVAPPLLQYLRAVHAPGEAIVLGTGLKTSAEMAALLNGSFGAALEYDDVYSAMPGHPAAIIVPALCTEAIHGPIEGARMLEAFIVGYEAGAKLARGIGMGHYQRRGFHATGTLAMFCALAALARLRNLGLEQTETAFGIASSMAGGLRCQFGTMMKPFHSGWAARCAVAAVDLAQSGFTASLTAIENEDGGFIAAYGTEDSDPAAALDSLGNPWSLIDPGFALKKFPSCYAGHRPMDGLLTLKRELDLSPGNLECITCRVPPGSLRPMRYPDPKTGLEAKFSVPYALAAGVLDGRYSLWTFTDAAVARPAIKPLLAKVVALEDERCLGPGANQSQRSWGSRGFVEVEATTTAGKRSTVQVEFAPGHPQRELGWNDLHEKFIDCAQYAGVDKTSGEILYERLRDLRSCSDFTPLLNTMRNPARVN
jgi:2-methylcitrate dehydratase PrpD